MEKRYQVFISSTFQDLQGARQEVSQALLRADCFPAGMELFPAADEEQFEFIKTVIDQSDYYIIISAGRYGSIHPETGLSYTEMEYDYAVETGKPVIRLLHKDPFNELKGAHIERTAKGRKALQKFRNKMKDKRLVALWSSQSELGLKVREGLENAKRRYPSSGWIRASAVQRLGAPSDISGLECQNLVSKLSKFSENAGLLLTAKLELEEGKPPVGPFVVGEFDGEDLSYMLLELLEEYLQEGRLVTLMDFTSSLKSDNWIMDYKSFLHSNFFREEIWKQIYIQDSGRGVEVSEYDAEYLRDLANEAKIVCDLEARVPEYLYYDLDKDFELEDCFISNDSLFRVLELLASVGAISVHGVLRGQSGSQRIMVTRVGIQMLYLHRSGAKHLA